MPDLKYIILHLLRAGLLLFIIVQSNLWMGVAALIATFIAYAQGLEEGKSATLSFIQKEVELAELEENAGARRTKERSNDPT